MRTEITAADLITVVCAVPGVEGLEAGIASTLRTLDARIRRDGAAHSRYGLIVDSTAGTVTVEVALNRHAPVRAIVEAVQRAVRDALASAEPRSHVGWQVLVRVQSISPTAPSAAPGPLLQSEIAERPHGNGLPEGLGAEESTTHAR